MAPMRTGTGLRCGVLIEGEDEAFGEKEAENGGGGDPSLVVSTKSWVVDDADWSLDR